MLQLQSFLNAVRNVWLSNVNVIGITTMIKPNNFFLPYQTLTRIKHENNANKTKLSGRDIYIYIYIYI